MSFKTRSEREYVAFLWDAFQSNYESGKFEFAKFVKRRNRIAHPSGTIFFNDRTSIDREISEMMQEVANIQQHMRPIILEAYGCFLEGSADIDEREYALPEQEIEASLIHRNYISQKDIEVCLGFDLGTMTTHPHYGGMCELHDTVKVVYLP